MYVIFKLIIWVIFHIITSPSTAYGTDGITSQLLKLACPYIVPVILHICNISISKKCFPDLWKTATITALHKKGDHSDPTNFRPISILPSVSKILEKIIHTQLYKYLTDNNTSSTQQSGFRKGHSTGTCLVNFPDKIYQSIDEGVPCGVLFVDLCKAFHTVDHSILLHKLRLYGLKLSAVSWICSYLTNRFQITNCQIRSLFHSLSHAGYLKVASLDLCYLCYM